MKLMNKTPLILDISTPLDTVLSLAMNRPDPMKNDCVIITRKGKFAGVAYTSDLIRAQA